MTIEIPVTADQENRDVISRCVMPLTYNGISIILVNVSFIENEINRYQHKYKQFTIFHKNYYKVSVLRLEDVTRKVRRLLSVLKMRSITFLWILVDFLVDRLVHRLMDWLIHRLVDLWANLLFVRRRSVRIYDLILHLRHVI